VTPPTRRPNVAILGTGANGGGIAADLARAGHRVTLIDQWPENVEAIRSNGLTVEMPTESHTTDVRVLHLCELATLAEEFDVVFLVVKAYDTRWACELIKPYLSDDPVVVGLQNGMTIDDMVDILGARHVLGAVIEIAAAMYRPGIVERHTPPDGSWFGLGGLDPAAHRKAPMVKTLLEPAGDVALYDDIRSAKWMKLLVNAAELVPSAIVDLPLLEAARLPGMHDFMVAAGKEAARTSVALGNAIVPIFGLPDLDPSDPDKSAEILLDTVYAKWSLPETRTTVLQDWMKGRRSEVREINGLVVRASEELGLSAPANAVTLRVGTEIEEKARARGPENAAELINALG
jgi:2-dehydropantoate 2-reductase